MADLSITLDGDWKRAETIVNNYPLFVRKLKVRLIEGVADLYYRMLVAHFERQDLPLAPLSRWYAQWKAKRGLDSRVLIATGEMLGEIKKHKTATGYFVGVKAGKRHRMGGIDIALLALIHEYGSTKRDIQARPVYRTTLSELRGILNSAVEVMVHEVWTEVMAK